MTSCLTPTPQHPTLLTTLTPQTGGWNPTTGEIPSDLLEEIDQAFSNVQLAFQDAGVREGWKGVYRVNSYHAEFEKEEVREKDYGLSQSVWKRTKDKP